MVQREPIILTALYNCHGKICWELECQFSKIIVDRIVYLAVVSCVSVPAVAERSAADDERS